MKFAVAGGGRVSGSFVARLPGLASALGPVAAQSYRLASRIVNSIGAGQAVPTYANLNGSPLILICVPPSGVASIVSALAEALACEGKTILLCEGGADSRQLAQLRSKGASVGSLQSIPGFDGRRFVAEGDRSAMLEAKRLITRLGARVEQISSAKIAVYAAGLTFGASLITPLLEASLQCLLDAGMTKSSAMKVVDGLCQNALRGYLYAGKRSWSGPLAAGDQAAARREWEALSTSRPLLARLYRESASVAVELLAGSGWTI
jgi:predicted short-subunit dehydrogenase-like oxidoreductase (DUF2520 family)